MDIGGILVAAGITIALGVVVDVLVAWWVRKQG